MEGNTRSTIEKSTVHDVWLHNFALNAGSNLNSTDFGKIAVALFECSPDESHHEMCQNQVFRGLIPHILTVSWTNSYLLSWYQILLTVSNFGLVDYNASEATGKQ